MARKKTLKERIDSVNPNVKDYFDRVDKAFYNSQQSYYQWKTRLNKHFKSMLSTEKMVFYTLTLNEKSLLTVSDKVLERKVKQWCRDNLSVWIGNRDYGDENGRLHWHVAGVPKDLKNGVKHDSWLYGAINFKRQYNYNEKRISNYIVKLTRHAMKESAFDIFRSRSRL